MTLSENSELVRLECKVCGQAPYPPGDVHPGPSGGICMGKLWKRRYVPLDAVVEALRVNGQQLGDLTWNPEEPAAFIQLKFGGG